MSESGKIIDATTVRFERLVDGPIERVWDYLCKREFLSTWLADGELGPGGAEFTLKLEGRKVPMHTGAKIVGVVTRFDPPRTLSYTWNHIAPGASAPTTPESVVTFELEPRGNKVLIVLTHGRIAPEFLARLSTGWHAFLDIMALRRQEMEPAPLQEMFGQLLPKYEALVAAARV